MQNLAHLIKAVRRRLSEQDLELLQQAQRRYKRESYDEELYDQAFDRVLARVREQGPELQQGSGTSS